MDPFKAETDDSSEIVQDNANNKDNGNDYDLDSSENLC